MPQLLSFVHSRRLLEPGNCVISTDKCNVFIVKDKKRVLEEKWKCDEKLGLHCQLNIVTLNLVAGAKYRHSTSVHVISKEVLKI